MLVDLLEELPTIEARRHIPTVMVQHTVLGALSKNTPAFKDLLPRYAQQATPDPHPVRVMDDLALGVSLGLVSQAFVDGLDDLAEASDPNT